MHDNYEIHDLAEELMAKYSHYQLARYVAMMEIKIKELEEQLDTQSTTFIRVCCKHHC